MWQQKSEQAANAAAIVYDNQHFSRPIADYEMIRTGGH